MRRAGRLDQARARRVGDAGDHGASHRAGDLYAGETEAPRGPGDQNALARLDLGAIAQGEPRGRVGQAHRRALGMIHRGGHDEALRLRHYRELSVGAPFDQRHDAVAGLAGRHAAAHRAHYAGELLARRERSRRQDLVLALDHEDVGKVEAGGVHLDQHLARTRGRVGGDLDPLRGDRSVLVDDDGSHFRTASFASPRRG